MKKVLVLGAGYVAKPLVEYLLKTGFNVVVASRTLSKAESLVGNNEAGKAIELNVNDDKKLDELVNDSELVVSLLPYTYHVKVAKICIKHSKHLITTSYVSEEMKNLDNMAKTADVLLLNEIGLDPGIDHMSAMKIIDEARQRYGKVVSFASYCGGLPAFQSNNNPFGYKFSWSPRGVVMAGKNNGQFLKDSRVVFIPAKDLFKNYRIIEIEGLGTFEAYTNRNSLPYREIYGLYDTETLFRGTLRNIGWCYTMDKARELGLFDDSKREDLNGLTYRELVEKLIGVCGCDDILLETAYFLGIEPWSPVIKRFLWLGLFEDKPLPSEDNVMDMFCHLLKQKLTADKDDLDLIVLYHEFIIKYGNKKEFVTSTLIVEGTPVYSAMSRTVSLPAAIACRLILEGKIKERGVHIPVKPDIYMPVLDELARLGIECVERRIELKD